MSSDNRKVIDFQRYKERREYHQTLSSEEVDVESDFQGKLRLTTEDAEMIIYCLRLGREYFKVEAENLLDNVDQPQRDLERANQLLDRIQFEVLKLQVENVFIVSLSLTELAFILDCVEMTRSAGNHGIDVFQAELGDKEHYVKWLEGTFFYLVEVYEKWRFITG